MKMVRESPISENRPPAHMPPAKQKKNSRWFDRSLFVGLTHRPLNEIAIEATPANLDDVAPLR